MTELIDDLAEKPRTISKWSFECLVFVFLIALTTTEIIVVEAACRALGVRYEGALTGVMIMINVVLARVGVDGILKWFRLSRSGKALEVWGRTVAIPEGEIADGEVVEVRCSRSLLVVAGLMCLSLSLVIAAILATVPHDKMTGVGYAYAIIAFCGLAGCYLAYESRWGTPQARADASGITGVPVGPHFCRRFVAWSSIATCEIETFHDTFGKSVLIRPILKGSDGEALLTLNLLHTNFEDQERLMKYIRAKLPKPKDDLWD